MIKRHLNIHTKFIVGARTQSGYILILSSIFLFVLIASSAHFFYRTTENTTMSGTSRDSTQALLLAESAMEHLRGQMVLNRLNTDNTTRVAGCIDANNVTSDICEVTAIRQNMSNPINNLFAYMFYISTANAIDNTVPSMLQRVANGEAQEVAAATLGSQKIVTSKVLIRINDLFGNSFKPRLYKLTANSMLVASAQTSWDAETSPEKAAAWIEVIQNPNNADTIDLIVQAAAQVGKAKSYVQRYVGSFSQGSTLGSVSLLSEASNIDRGI